VLALVGKRVAGDRSHEGISITPKAESESSVSPGQAG
jgi:hypothetical protein